MAEAKTTLRVQITADLADIKQGLGLLRGEIGKIKQQAASASPAGGLFGSAANELKGLLGPLGLAAVAAKIFMVGKEALATADELGKLSQSTGASIDTLSALRVAVHGSREELDLIAQSLPKLAKLQDDAASGNEKAARSFERLGIPLADVKRLDPGELFGLIATKLGPMQAGAEKTAIAMDLFGKNGAKLVPILNELADGGLDDARKRAEELGLALTDDVAAAADAAGDELGDMKLVAEGLATTFLSKFAPAVAQAMKGFRESVTSGGVGAMEILGQAAGGVIQTVTSLFVSVGKIIGASVALVVNGVSTLSDVVARVLDRDLDGALKRFRSGLSQGRAMRDALFSDLRAEGNKVWDAFAGSVAVDKKDLSGGTGTEGDPEADKGKAKKIVAGAVDAAEMAIDAIERQLKALDIALEDGLVSLADYYAKKRQLEEAAIDAEIAKAEAQAKGAKSSEEQSRALTKIQQLQLDRAEIGPRIAREQAEAEKKLAEELQGVADQLAQLEGRTDEAIRGQLERQFAKLRKQLEAESNAAGLAMLDKLINTKAFEAKLGDLQGKVSEALQRLQTAEGSIASQVDAGLLPQSTGEQQLHDLRQRTLEQLRELRAATAAWLATMAPDDPNAAKALQFLQQLDGEIAQVESSQHQFRGQVIDTATDALEGFFNKIATGAKLSIGLIKEMVVAFVQGLARMAAEALAKRAILAIFNAFGGGGGAAGLSAFIPGVGGVGRHTGGIVGSGGLTRFISPYLLGAAPRYHGGGIAGLAPDEVGAVLRRDEEVLTRQDARHRWNGGRNAPAQRDRYQVLAFGEKQVADALAGLAGEDVVVTHMMNNKDKLTGGGG